MEYKGYKVTEEENRVVVENIRDFDTKHIFECGQCFRWLKQADGSYTGVAGGRVANVKQLDGTLVISNCNLEDFKKIWFEYLDLGRDYSAIKQKLRKDDIMEKAMEFGYGIRLLKQDIRETLISFIISANNRIPMIMKTVAAISKAYGDKITYDGKDYYAFPDIARLSDSNVEALAVCGGGFRCKYIVGTSRMVTAREVDLDMLKGMSAQSARDTLKKFPGVGDKVADCTMLYSGTKYDVFPTDVWVKRVMEELYFKREASFGEIQRFAAEYFGELAGFAQQYLFYYARENRIGAKG